MPIDLSKLKEAAGRIKPPESEKTPPPARGANALQDNTLLDAAAGAARERARLASESSPPGTEPDEDPVAKAIADGHAAGGRNSDRAFQAYTQTVLDAAVAGDPRVAHQGVVDTETREKWLEQARQRDIANRDKQTPAR